jgi:signal transduction histidine kinase
VVAARAEIGRTSIEVKDDGAGVPLADMDRIFDPFYTTKENGTGLGLSVVHQIVQQHGGSIAARSNSGGGTSFQILLPCRQGSSR